MGKMYVLYSEKACGNRGTEHAVVFVSCDSMKEAKSYKGQFGSMACYSYDKEDGKLVNERWEWDYYPKLGG
jgi:hypothetical protein